MALSLLCTFADGAAPTRLSFRMAVLGIGTRVGTCAMRRRAMQHLLFPAAFLKDVDRAVLDVRLQQLFGRDLADTPPIVTEQLRSMSACNVTAALFELAGIPALVVSGRHDPIAPPALGRAIADGISGARYVEFDEAGHALPVQCADRVNALLLEHLDAAD
jgi:aminoacrylate hydrolase